ncbi:hypothetical protein EYF80_037658 [Liparis tanakae]|uniref:Uncharacterized protein n=1 Tax=Liparis tanakae TaxID=230148 RepID=A0A4Z2GFE4_9TELE|nr:hypothetical protein EYF80_037658 [Liparis tanakae]
MDPSVGQEKGRGPAASASVALRVRGAPRRSAALRSRETRPAARGKPPEGRLFTIDFESRPLFL